MKFINSTLLPKEKITFETRPHWIVFGWPVVVFIIAFWFWADSGRLLNFNFMLPVINIPFTTGIRYALFLVAFYQLLMAYIMYFFSEYGVTNERVIMKEGMIYRTSLEIFWDKIEAIHVDQGIVGRLLSYGTITIVGTGGSHDVFSYIPDPLTFRERVQTEIETNEQHRH